ncbi:fimbria/pilus periplasmic chaperone [Xanthomonas campestris pv. badrii]|uniref:Fimbria/pilus periplasmic chaperone n=1 Tax=Xanthomonas campestris pv. badrii TaxID=149696 RepID=A0A7Z2V7R6_XANCA|nr:fimbria/pilus periplasmic chaperone [Xanthomonas campestris]MCC4605476.1 fimbria/pilus periplasmic chaperone [Xanthomonas campestris pv. parthenii]QJD66500.1 fimbria/pilus periplasmic chaperone [Xanthomonas campestris pv. badrii]
MHIYGLRIKLQALLAVTTFAFSLSVSANGITVGGTRIVYPAEQKVRTISVSNSSKHSTFLVQSWVEDALGKRTHDFVVTPPLYSSGPGDENTVRLIYVGGHPATDHEELYYFNSKAIPSIDKDSLQGKNMLLIATVTRLKLFLRPHGLKLAVDQAPSKLTFEQNNGNLIIRNPTPYYLTLCGMKVGSTELETLMVAPNGSEAVPMKGMAGDSITFHTINDYGATTPEQRSSILKKSLQ